MRITVRIDSVILIESEALYFLESCVSNTFLSTIHDPFSSQKKKKKKNPPPNSGAMKHVMDILQFYPISLHLHN